MDPILVCTAWPYANGSLHVGHLAGVYVPADVFARYKRLRGFDVLMVSGTDAHGTPVTVRADQEGVSPREVAERYHQEYLGYWRDLGISFDLYTTTMTDNHARVSQDEFMMLLEKGYLFEAESTGFYDPVAKRFLPDTYIEGECPHCHYGRARGNQCENCGRLLEPEDLINPRSRLNPTAQLEQRQTVALLSRPAQARAAAARLGRDRRRTGARTSTASPSTSSRAGCSRAPSRAT